MMRIHSVSNIRRWILALSVVIFHLSLSAATPEAVDLGLSVKWADRNFETVSPEIPGLPYSWGELTYKGNLESFVSQNWLRGTRRGYGLPQGDVLSLTNDYYPINFDAPYYRNPIGGKEWYLRTLKKKHDIVANTYGSNWRMPSAAEWNELAEKCKIEVIKIPGKKDWGYLKVTGPNGNSIILVANGFYGLTRKEEQESKSKSKHIGDDKICRYWSSDAAYDKVQGQYYYNGIVVFQASIIKDKNVETWVNSGVAHPWYGCYIRPVYDDGGGSNDNNDNTPVVKGDKPVVEWPGLSESTHSKSLTVKVGIKSKSQISSAVFYINGQQSRGIKAVTNDGYDMVLNPTVPLTSGSNQLKVVVTNAAGTTTSERSVFYMPVDDDKNNTPVVKGDKPVVEWPGLSESTHSKSLTVKVGIKSKSQISSAVFYINGQQSRGIKAVTNDGYDMVLNPTVPLTSGSNQLKVVVTNTAGTTTSERSVFYMPVDDEDRKENVVQEKRIALVVGNSAYTDNPLPNPVNDATDMSNKLRALGFDVMLVTDATKRKLEDNISDFARKAAGCDVAMFYYAGHGIQYNGANYLIPVDATLRSAKDIEYECTDVNRVLANMEDSGCKMNIIALDACRNNPFERSWFRGSKTRGLSAINAPVGSFISYATSPGSVAIDGATRNSPYTQALLETLDVPGLPIESVFKRVAARVYEQTSHSQTPWYSSSLFQGDFIFNKK